MHIKSIIIEGFKSYRERTVVGPLGRGQNVVVGRNGSGKSSLFTAGMYYRTSSNY
jgi:structural maintenance of chromosome 3 (chondroitin sulfate proteoglycan 6)